MMNLLSIKISYLIIKILIRRALSLGNASKYLTGAFQIRNSCDYDDFYIVSKANAEEQYRKVDEMIHVIIDYLSKSEEQ